MCYTQSNDKRVQHWRVLKCALLIEVHRVWQVPHRLARGIHTSHACLFNTHAHTQCNKTTRVKMHAVQHMCENIRGLFKPNVSTSKGACTAYTHRIVLTECIRCRASRDAVSLVWCRNRWIPGNFSGTKIYRYTEYSAALSTIHSRTCVCAQNKYPKTSRACNQNERDTHTYTHHVKNVHT